MPLQKSKSCNKKKASENIREMRHAGHPQAQSVAAGMKAAGCKKKRGGKR